MRLLPPPARPQDLSTGGGAVRGTEAALYDILIVNGREFPDERRPHLRVRLRDRNERDWLPSLVVGLVLVIDEVGDAADDDPLRRVVHAHAKQKAVPFHLDGDRVAVVLAYELVGARAVSTSRTSVEVPRASNSCVWRQSA
jgi:hypothetical protein